MRNAEREAQVTVQMKVQVNLKMTVEGMDAFMPGSLITLWRMSNDYLQIDATQATHLRCQETTK
jgi:hypothetical protein